MNEMKRKHKKIQAARRRTLFPLLPAEVCEQRMRIAGLLRRSGMKIYAIRQVMNLSPEQVRRYIAKDLAVGHRENSRVDAALCDPAHEDVGKPETL
jgi:hypothetical protein